MKAYRVEKKDVANGVIHLDALPFSEGELVELIVLSHEEKIPASMRSSLHGKVIEYTNPIAKDDWEVMQ